MQKARVITRSPEDAGHLADQLRSYGYAVEIVAPGQTNVLPADIEIEMESCGMAEALDRAAELAHADDSDVYVAAGCFREEKLLPSPGVVMPARPTVADTVNGVAAGLQNKRDLLAKALREQRALMREARIAQRQRREQEAERQPVQQAESARLAEEPPPTRRTREWRMAFVIAAIFAAVLTLGWSAATRAPVSPLSPGLVNGHPSLEEQTPFGAATVRPQIAKPASTLIPMASLPAAKPSAMPQAAQSTLPKHIKETRKPSRLKREHKYIRTADAEAADVAEDQVRRVPPSQTAPAQTRSQSPQNATLKRYSDME